MYTYGGNNTQSESSTVPPSPLQADPVKAAADKLNSPTRPKNLPRVSDSYRGDGDAVSSSPLSPGLDDHEQFL